MVLFEETLFWSTQVLIRPTFQDVLVSLVCSCFFPFLTVCWNAKTGYQKKTHIRVKITTWATQSVHVSFFSWHLLHVWLPSILLPSSLRIPILCPSEAYARSWVSQLLVTLWWIRWPCHDYLPKLLVVFANSRIIWKNWKNWGNVTP